MSSIANFINIGRGLNKTVWLDKLIWNWKETNQIPDSFLPKNKLLYPVYAGDRNSDQKWRVFPVANPPYQVHSQQKIVTESKRAMAPLVSIYL